MKISYDKEADAIYFTISETTQVAESEEVRPGIVLDFDDNNRVIGVEILSASQRMSNDEIKKVLIDVA
jgi:uncharacterized protein YuzE